MKKTSGFSCNHIARSSGSTRMTNVSPSSRSRAKPLPATLRPGVPHQLPSSTAGRAAARARTSGNVTRLLIALKGHPGAVEHARSQVLAADPVVEHPGVAPHDSRVVVRVQLEQEEPVIGARLELRPARIAVAGGVSAIEAMRDQLRLKLHVSLDRMRMPEQVVERAPGLTGGELARERIVGIPLRVREIVRER